MPFGTLANYKRNALVFVPGFVASMLGDSARSTALTIWVFTSTNESPVARVSLLLATTIPTFFLGPWVGRAADRWNKLMTLRLSNAIAGVLSIFLALAIFRGSFPLLLALALVSSSVGVVTRVSSFVVAPAIAPRGDLPRFTNMLELGMWVANVGGPSLGAWLTIRFDAGWVLVADGVTYFVAAIFAMLISLDAGSETPSGETPERQPGFIEGLRLLHSARLLHVMVSSVGVSLSSAVNSVGLIFLVSQSLALSPGAIGPIISISAASAIAASVWMLRKPPNDLKKWLLLSVLGLVASQVFMGLAPNFVLLSAAVILSGLSNAPFNVTYESLVQLGVPDNIRGFMQGIDMTLNSAARSIGLVVSGGLLALSGPRVLILVGAVLIAACSTPMVLSRSLGKPT